MSALSTDLLRLRRIVIWIDDIDETIEQLGVTERQYVSPEGLEELTRSRAIDLMLTQLCEQAREVTDETRARMDGVPWTSVTEVRNYLQHGYDSVSVEIVWNIITTKLAPLRAGCVACIAEMERGEYPPAHKSRTAERRARGGAD